MHTKITLLPGDGIGPEVVAEGVKVLQAIGQKLSHTFDFAEALAGGIAITPDELVRATAGAIADLKAGR